LNPNGVSKTLAVGTVSVLWRWACLREVRSLLV
jgi:hypothetical protein